MFALQLNTPPSWTEKVFAKLALVPRATQQHYPSRLNAAAWPRKLDHKLLPTSNHAEEQLLPAPVLAAADTSAPAAPAMPALFPATVAPQGLTEVAQEKQQSAFCIPNKELLRANRVLDLQRRCVDSINLKQPFGCHVMAWSLIPTEVWEGCNATFMMMVCDFFSASAANTFLMPTSRKGVEHLQLPQHLYNTPSALIRDAKVKISALQAAFAQEHQVVCEAMLRGDMSVLSNRAARKQKYTSDVHVLAKEIGILTFGQAAWAQHQKLFALLVNYETPPAL